MIISVHFELKKQAYIKQQKNFFYFQNNRLTMYHRNSAEL